MDFKPYRPEQVQHGVRFAVTIENPLDRSLIVSEASFRAEPFPPEGAYANAIELLVPAASYEVPISCAPGKRTVRLNPPLKVGPKDLGVVVFKAPPGQYACLLYVSLKTNQGSTAEQKAESL